VIVSCHGFLKEGHGLNEEHVKTSLDMADKVHFVSQAQQNVFKLPERKHFIIPNTSQQISKTVSTSNIGTFGTLNSNKNVEESVKIATASNACQIHVWGVEKDIWRNNRIIVHNWEKNRNKIYNSFDVLVFMSKSETFGLVVIEAMSAGIPCLLSNIPAFQEFNDCPGIIIAEDTEITSASTLLNKLLSDKEQVKHEMQQYFQKQYSKNVIAEKWFKQIRKLIT
jgi:glycosyltransferase involved in cell wall biosynthesis